jgi:exodeoxyribonuclease-5
MFNTPPRTDLQPQPVRTGLVEAFAKAAAEQARRDAELAEWRADMRAAQNTPAQEAERSPVEWSPQQLTALARIKRWYLSSAAQVFYLAGYAGTGKTTLGSAIKDLLGISPVEYASLTGKAASVMAAKGCIGATTIHRLIYRPLIEFLCRAEPPCGPTSYAGSPCGRERCIHRREAPAGWTLNDESRIRNADLVIIDEISMVGEKLGKDLLSFGKKILVLGDKGQLPRIDEWDVGFFTDRTPDFELTEIHRQALGSPVIQLATAVRNGNRLQPGRYGDSVVTDKNRMAVTDLLLHDQVIIGTHATRADINQRIRRKLGFGGDVPQAGERVLCEKNDHLLGLHNGTIWTVVNAVPDRHEFLDMTIKSDDGRVIDVVAPIPAFTAIKGASTYPKNPFSFAYAITCHKSQGSQWNSVCVFDESGKWKEDRFKWTYAAITRAAKRVTVMF